MKIAIVNHGVFPDVRGGMERHTYNFARHLQERGVEAHVLVPEPRTETQFPFPVHHLPWPKRPFWLWSNYEFTKNVARWIESEKPDVAFGQGFNLWAYLKRRRIPCVFHPHGLEMFGNHLRGFEHLTAIPFRKLVRYHGRNSDTTISLGGRLTDILVRRAGIPRTKIVEIPNAVDIEEFKVSQEPRRPNSFLFVGRLAFNKGIDLLTEAMGKVRDLELTLSIVGDGPMRGDVHQLCRTDPRVRWLGDVAEEELRRQYQLHECLLFTSRFEGMPTVILEAMASGCCVVATDIGAVNVLVDPETGILVPPMANTISEGVRCFMSLAKEEKLRLAHQARKKVEEKFSWSHVMRRYQDLHRVP